jgi:hypothetical protein
MTLAGFKFAYERRRNFKISTWINLRLNFNGGLLNGAKMGFRYKFKRREILKIPRRKRDKILRTRFKFRYKISLRRAVKFRKINAVVYAAKFTSA